MDLHLLGPVEASVDDRPVSIGAGKPRALLTMLALNEGTVVSSEALIDGLWGEAPPATANKMVQVYVSQLRKALRVSGNAAEIVTRGHGYELRLGGGEVDAHRFERLVADGDAREALALWRGPPLDDVATEPFAGLEIRRLEDLRLSAIELALEQDLAAGRNTEVIHEAQAVLAREPLRERLHALRMLALYRSGRQADALGAYRRARDELVNAIGVEPGPELRRLHEAVLRQDPSLDLPVPAELPPELDVSEPLQGRGEELDALRAHWRRAKAGEGAELLVAGARGMGKTRLVAELATVVQADGGHVLYASGAGSPEAARRVIGQGRAVRRPTLLIVDDLDHAPAEVTAELERVAVSGRPLLVLATAEQAGDATMTLGPLAEPAVEAIVREYGDGQGRRPARGERGRAPARSSRRASVGAPRGRSPTRSDRRSCRGRACADARGGGRSRRVGRRAAGGERARRAPARIRRRRLPVQGPRELRRRRRGRLLRPRAARRRDGRADRGHAAVGHRRALGQRQVVGSERRAAAGAPARRPSGERGWAIALLRPGAHPLAALEQAVAQTSPHGRLVIAVDQFEELFTACHDEAERAAFADALVAAVRDPRRRALVLVALRADFYGRCASYPELWRMLGASHVPVGPMRRDELRRAIVLPRSAPACTSTPSWSTR